MKTCNYPTKRHSKTNRACIRISSVDWRFDMHFQRLIFSRKLRRITVYWRWNWREQVRNKQTLEHLSSEEKLNKKRENNLR